MKNNNLEERIVNRVYRIETKRTTWYVVSRIVLFVLGTVTILILGMVAYDIFVEQGSFDLIDFKGDDFEVINKYFADNLSVFVEEAPKELLLVLALTITGFVYLIHKIRGSYRKMKNKLISIYKFYKKRT